MGSGRPVCRSCPSLLRSPCIRVVVPEHSLGQREARCPPRVAERISSPPGSRLPRSGAPLRCPSASRGLAQGVKRLSHSHLTLAQSCARDGRRCRKTSLVGERLATYRERPAGTAWRRRRTRDRDTLRTGRGRRVRSGPVWLRSRAGRNALSSDRRGVGAPAWLRLARPRPELLHPGSTGQVAPRGAAAVRVLGAVPPA
jgi:hypothetical protein